MSVRLHGNILQFHHFLPPLSHAASPTHGGYKHGGHGHEHGGHAHGGHGHDGHRGEYFTGRGDHFFEVTRNDLNGCRLSLKPQTSLLFSIYFDKEISFVLLPQSSDKGVVTILYKCKFNQLKLVVGAYMLKRKSQGDTDNIFMTQ